MYDNKTFAELFVLFEATLVNSISFKQPWDRISPVGLMWGNDPELDQATFENGGTPCESWINPRAEEIRRKLGGSRPSWGWNGRMNGPGISGPTHILPLTDFVISRQLHLLLCIMSLNLPVAWYGRRKGIWRASSHDSTPANSKQSHKQLGAR